MKLNSSGCAVDNESNLVFPFFRIESRSNDIRRRIARNLLFQSCRICGERFMMHEYKDHVDPKHDRYCKAMNAWSVYLRLLSQFGGLIIRPNHPLCMTCHKL